MKRKRHNSYLLLLVIFLSACRHQPQQAVEKLVATSNLYTLVKNWPQLPAGYMLGNPTGIGIDSAQHVFIFHRAGRSWPILRSMPETFISQNTILMLDRHSGKILNSWGANLFIMPHGLTVDNNNNIWVTDVALQQIFKFSHEGKLLMKLGVEKTAGNDSLHFDRPTDVAVTSDGSFYVSDGYGNSRVIKFSSTGKYLFEWGKKGNKPGEFNLPHAIDLDEKGRVYVADRENSRVQVFDSNGKFLDAWKNKLFGKIYAISFDKLKKNLIAVDYVVDLLVLPKGSDIIIFDSTGTLQNQFGRGSLYNGPVRRYHDIAIDNEGSIYVGDILGNTIQKFRRVDH